MYLLSSGRGKQFRNTRNKKRYQEKVGSDHLSKEGRKGADTSFRSE